ncbi:MAG: HAD-IC family P-type ATPase, partial [Chlamydiota bacterium]
KTGTLTTGELSLTKVESLQNKPLSEDEEKRILSIAASLERHIVHPIATAIVTYAQKNRIPFIEIIDFKSQPGFGLQGKYNDALAAIGLPEFISSLLPQEQQQAFSEKLSSVQRDGQVLACLLFEGNVYLFRFTDSIREKAKELISILESKTNITSVMLTGDHANTANTVAKLLGIEKVYADLRPEDKLNLVAKLSQESGLAMVGDGINDAPALARATIGISLGKIGSATAVDASDVVLLNDDLHLIHWLMNKAHKTIKIVKENLSLALSVIFLATTPALLGLVPLWLAVVLHEGGTVLVGLNSLRLLKK